MEKSLEKRTRRVLGEFCESIEDIDGVTWKLQKVKLKGKTLMRAPETAFKWFDKWYKEQHKGEKWNLKLFKNQSLGGTKRPDDCFIDMVRKIAFWFECKSQTGAGSVNEKLQTYHHKIRNWKERYPDIQIMYIYVLSKNFKDKNSKAYSPQEIKYINEDIEHGTPLKIIWDDDEHFQDSLLEAIGL